MAQITEIAHGAVDYVRGHFKEFAAVGALAAGSVLTMGATSAGSSVEAAAGPTTTESATTVVENPPVLGQIRLDACDPQNPTVVHGEVQSTGDALQDPAVSINGTDAVVTPVSPTEIDFSWVYGDAASELNFALSATNLQFGFFDTYAVPVGCVAENATTTTTKPAPTTTKPAPTTTKPAPTTTTLPDGSTTIPDGGPQPSAPNNGGAGEGTVAPAPVVSGEAQPAAPVTGVEPDYTG